MPAQQNNHSPELTIYYSYACRDTYLLFRLLRQVRAEGETLEITWSPFAIEIDNNAGYWEHTWKSASSELRGFIAAAAAHQQGETAFRSFHDSLEAAVHEQLLELGDEDTLLGAAERAGLDLERFKSDWQNPELAERARRSHETAARQYGVFGTPTILFPNGQAIHTEPVEDMPLDQALWVFHGILHLGFKHPYFSKLERITPAK